MILGIIVLTLLGILVSLTTVMWIKGDNKIETMFNTLLIILLCILICNI